MRLGLARHARRRFQRRQRRQVDQDRRHALHVVDELHVVVPLVVGDEGLHAPRRLVLGDLLEVRVPVRVHGPERLEVASHPVEIGVSPLPLRDLDPVMDRHEAGPVRDRLLDGRVHCAAAVVEEDDDVVDAGEVLGPMLDRVDRGPGIRIVLVDLPGQVDGPGDELVVAAGAMRGGVGDEDDLLDAGRGFLAGVVEDLEVGFFLGAGPSGEEDEATESESRESAVHDVDSGEVDVGVSRTFKPKRIVSVGQTTAEGNAATI